MSNFIKDNGGPLVVGAVFLAIILGYIELRIPPIVVAEIESRGIVSSDKIDSMEGDIEDNEGDIGELTTRWNRLVDAISAGDDGSQ